MFRFLILSALLACALGAAVPNHRGLRPDGRIVGGVETTIQQFPYQISLRYYESHRCGGSVFKPAISVTAAHCVYGISSTNLAVVAGSTHRSEGGVKRALKKYIIHELYDDWEYDYDVAILVLAKGFELSESIQAIPLASINEAVRGGTKALVTGWGTLQEGGFSPTNLQVVDVITVSNEQCAKDYEGINGVTEGMLCAGHPEGGRDACQGDSGGPLVIGSKLFGIVSWGLGCARADYPGVYAKVATFRAWFNENISAAEKE